MKTKIAIIGYLGLVGDVLYKHFADHPKYELVCRIDVGDRNEELIQAEVEVAIVFARGPSTIDRIMFCLKNGIHVVNGTTGLDFEDVALLQDSKDCRASFFTASNFALKSVLGMEGAVKIAQYAALSDITITEYHRAGKLDKPSGTAKTTAERIFEVKGIDCKNFEMKLVDEEIGIEDPDADCTSEYRTMNRYTLDYGGIKIISIRSDAYVARQMVEIDGDDYYAYAHDAPDRKAYIPGIERAIAYVLDTDQPYTSGLLSIL